MSDDVTRQTPPRGLRWADTPAARSIATIISVVAILAAIGLGVRQQAYISCVAEHQKADAVRTAAISRATDNERRAQRLLIANIKPGDSSGLRAAVLDSYDATDRVRAANPPGPADGC